MLNKVLLIGNTTRPMELRYLPSGAAVAKTGLAVNRTWKDKMSGEQRQEVMFIDISIFGKSAEIANQYMLKGKKVLIEGRLVLEQWVDQSGQKRSKHSISVDNFQFLDSKSSSEGDGGYEQPTDEYFGAKPSSQPKQNMGRTPEIDIQDDEIPF